MSHTTSASNQSNDEGRRQHLQRLSKDKTCAEQLQTNLNNKVRARSNTNNSRTRTTTPTNNNSNNVTNKQTTSKSSRKSGVSIAIPSATSLQNDNIEGAPTHHKKLPTSKSLFTSTIQGTPAVSTNKKRGSNVEKKLPAVASRVGEFAAGHRRRRRATIASFHQPQKDDLLSTKSNPYPCIGDVGYMFEKEFDDGWYGGEVIQIRSGAAMRKDRRCKYSDGDVEDLSLAQLRELAILAGKRNRKQHTNTTNNGKQNTSSNNLVVKCQDSMAPFSPLSPDIKAAVGGRTKSRRFRVKEGGAGGKRNVQKNLFSPSAIRVSTIDNDNGMLGSGRRKRVVRDFKEEEEDGSVTIVGSTDSGGMKTRGSVLAGTKSGSECAKKKNRKRQKIDNVPTPPSPSTEELEDTNIDVDDAPTIESAIQQARTHLKARRIDEAIKILHKTIKSLPNESVEEFYTLVNGFTSSWIGSTNNGKDMETNDLSFIRSLLEGVVNLQINKGPIAISHHFLAFVDKLYLNKLAACEVSSDVVLASILALKNEIEHINQKVQLSNNVAFSRKEKCKKYADDAREIVEDVICQIEEDETEDDDDEADGDWEEEEDGADDTLEEDKPPTRTTRARSKKEKTPKASTSKKKKKKSTKKAAAPKKGTQEFEADCENLLKRFAKLRKDNKYPKKSSKTCTDKAHPTPLPIDDCPELEGLLNIPEYLYSDPTLYPRECILVFNLCVEHYKRIKDIKSIGKQQLIHTLVQIPWDRPIDCEDPAVLALLNYCTLETGSRLGPGDHPATKKRPDKDKLSARSWNWIRDMVGEEIYLKMFHADSDPVDYPKDTTLSDLVSSEDYKRIIDSWSIVLKGMNEIFDHIALCSKETQKKWGDRVHGGAKGLEKDFRANPGKYISAHPNELNVLFHPSSLYDKLKWSMMYIKMPTCDAFGTDLIQKFPGHENEVCTHNMSIFNKNSEAYAQAQAAFEDGVALGREVRKQLWELKSAMDTTFAPLFDDDESPTADEIYTVGNLNQTKHILTDDEEVNKLYKWAVLKYDGDENVMNKMKQFATYWKDGLAVIRKVWALKSVIDEVIAPFGKSQTADEIYTVENFAKVSHLLLEDEEVSKLYKWAVLKYGDKGIMEKMIQFAMISGTNKKLWALKSAIDEAFAPLFGDQADTPTANDLYTVDNLNRIKSLLTKDVEVGKLYRWAVRNYDGDKVIMEKMKLFAAGRKKSGDTRRTGQKPRQLSDGRWTSITRFPGSGSSFSVGTYDSEDVAQRACEAANQAIKEASNFSDIESMKEVCRSAAFEATGIPSAKPQKEKHDDNVSLTIQSPSKRKTIEKVYTSRTLKRKVCKAVVGGVACTAESNTDKSHKGMCRRHKVLFESHNVSLDTPKKRKRSE